MRLEWRVYKWPDGRTRAERAADTEPDPLAFELRDLDADVSGHPRIARDVMRLRGTVCQWRIALKGRFEAVALGKVIGAYDTVDEAKAAVERVVLNAAGGKP